MRLCWRMTVLQMGVGEVEDDTHAGLRPILRWEVRMRLDTSGLSNPVNRKVCILAVLSWVQTRSADRLFPTATACCAASS